MREDGKHYRFVKNGRNLFTNKKGGYYVDIYEVAVVVETWYDNEMFDWTVYRGYCPSDWTNAEMQHVVGGFGDKQPAEYAYQFWTEDGLPKEKFRW